MAKLKDTLINGTLSATNLTLSKNLIVNDITFKSLVDDLATKYDISKVSSITSREALDITITDKGSWTTETIATMSCVRIGNYLRINVNATRSSATSAGNYTNETICNIVVTHNGKIRGTYNNSSVTYSSGALSSFYTGNASTNNTTLSFDVKIAASHAAVTKVNTVFLIPVTLNVDNF